MWCSSQKRVDHWSPTTERRRSFQSGYFVEDCVQVDAADEKLDDLDEMISSRAHAIPHERSGVNGPKIKISLRGREHAAKEMGRISEKTRSEVRKHRRKHSANMAEQRLAKLKGKTKNSTEIM